MRRLLILCLVTCGLAATAERAGAQPMAEKYMIDGKLADGEKALLEHLKKKPNDDQARFGLGVIQFLQTFEHLGTGLYNYGLRTERAFLNLPPDIRKMLPQNPNPDKISHADFRKLLQRVVDDLNRAEATLAKVKNPNVKLPLHVGRFRIDLFGLKKPMPAAFLFGQVNPGVPKELVDNFVIGFDRGDVSWLRGYLNFLTAAGEVLLATDTKELFDCTAHLFFERVDSPHGFLQDEARTFGNNIFNWSFANFIDITSFIHLTRFPMKEPERMKKALNHLEMTITMGKEMWKHILAEEDDDNEWIPNPKQKGVMGIQVTQQMVDEWLRVLDEADLVLKGQRLLPFWRGKLNEMGINKEVGINLNKFFTEPRNLDIWMWIQGTAATPYLEKGPITNFASPQMLQKLNGTFGGMNFFGFALWFN